jgi:predicted DNA binding CopG/RHH family protein
MKKKLVLPKFKNEDAERNFWAKIDLTDYYDSSDLVPVTFPNLKPTTQPISIRLSTSMINQLKEKANTINVPYQALIKQYVADGLERSVKKS